MSRVLVADDEIIIAMQLEAYVQNLGHELVGSASSGLEVVHLAEQLRPDIILMDIKMPGKVDGVEAARIIRRRFNIPVVFITAYAEDPLIERAKQAVPLGYIVKPFQGNEIKAAIQIAISQMNMERRLREHEQRYQMATIAGRVGVWDWDPVKGHVHLEPLLCELLGYPADRGRYSLEEWLAWVHPDDVERVRSELQAHSMGESSSLEIERRLLHKDGSVYWFLARARVIHDEGGESRLVIGTDVDITDRKRAEIALSQSKERFRNLVETTSDLIWELDRDRKFTYVSPRVMDLLGYRPEQLIASSPYRLLARGQTKLLREQLAHMAADGREPRCFETVFRHRDGFPVVIETSGISFQDAGGRLLGFRGIGRDVSERKRLQQALLDANLKLERKVVERTRHLLETTKILKQQRQELARRKADADRANQRLRETNAALTLLTKNIERNREESEKQLASLVRTKMLPLIRRIDGNNTSASATGRLKTLASYLEGLVASLSAGADIASRISEAEWNVAVLIRDGHGSREIAKRLGISVTTVKTHRRNIRRKLKLNNSSVNLGTYLMTKLS